MLNIIDLLNCKLGLALVLKKLRNVSNRVNDNTAENYQENAKWKQLLSK
jgi:hypothetical protein